MFNYELCTKNDRTYVVDFLVNIGYEIISCSIYRLNGNTHSISIIVSSVELPVGCNIMTKPLFVCRIVRLDNISIRPYANPARGRPFEIVHHSGFAVGSGPDNPIRLHARAEEEITVIVETPIGCIVVICAISTLGIRAGRKPCTVKTYAAPVEGRRRPSGGIILRMRYSKNTIICIADL